MDDPPEDDEPPSVDSLLRGLPLAGTLSAVDDDTCWGRGVDAPECGKPIVCVICEEHCLTEGGPEACWQAHEAWRLGKGDPTFRPGATTGHPPIGSLPPAPRPRWRS